MLRLSTCDECRTSVTLDVTRFTMKTTSHVIKIHHAEPLSSIIGKQCALSTSSSALRVASSLDAKRHFSHGGKREWIASGR
jgi:hypothetical protein